MPVTISRSGKCPWRTNRARLSSQLVGVVAKKACNLGLYSVRQ
jgi:hypothetical protein